MARTVAIGIQNFEELIQKNYFYIDKTSFIREWGEAGGGIPDDSGNLSCDQSVLCQYQRG